MDKQFGQQLRKRNTQKTKDFIYPKQTIQIDKNKLDNIEYINCKDNRWMFGIIKATGNIYIEKYKSEIISQEIVYYNYILIEQMIFPISYKHTYKQLLQDYINDAPNMITDEYTELIQFLSPLLELKKND